MKIVMLGQKGIPASFGGIERHVEDLSVRLVSLGYEVLVYGRTWYTGVKEKRGVHEYKGVSIRYLPTLHTKHLDAIVHTFLSTMHALFQKPDIFHYHGVGPALLSWIPRVFAPKARVFVTFHCIDRKHQKWGVLARFFLWLGEWCAVRFAHETIVVSKALKRYCSEVYGAETTYIPNGYFFDRQTSSDSLERLFLINRVYILAVSRLIRHKGLHHLISAFKNITGDYRLVVAGGIGDAQYEAELTSLAADDARVLLTGNLPPNDISALYDGAYMVVHPSEAEGLPIVVLEAFAHGKAVLVSDIAELEELVGNPEFIFHSKNVQDLSEKLSYLLVNPELVAMQGGVNAKKAELAYNWNVLAREVASLYQHSLEKKIEKFAVQ